MDLAIQVRDIESKGMNRDSLNKNSMLFITNSISGGGAERATNLLVNALHDQVQVALGPL